MNKIVLFGLIIALLTSCFCSTNKIVYVPNYEGVEIDGTKEEFYHALTNKGYYYNIDSTYVKGIYKNRLCNVIAVSNKETGMVWRVAISYQNPVTADSAKILFNSLVKGFGEDTLNYIPVNYDFWEFIIDDKENISKEIIINNKQYTAEYYQITGSPTDEKYKRQWITSTQIPAQYAGTPESELLEMYDYEVFSKKLVTIRIVREGNNDYNILIYFDNEHNKYEYEYE